MNKEKFREELAQYIADVRPKFPLKEISNDIMRQHLKVYKNKMYGNISNH